MNNVKNNSSIGSFILNNKIVDSYSRWIKNTAKGIVLDCLDNTDQVIDCLEVTETWIMTHRYHYERFGWFGDLANELRNQQRELNEAVISSLMKTDYKDISSENKIHVDVTKNIYRDM